MKRAILDMLAPDPVPMTDTPAPQDTAPTPAEDTAPDVPAPAAPSATTPAPASTPAPAPAASAPAVPDFRGHLAGLMAQAERLKSEYPDFDLRQELKSPEFLRMTAPGVGLSLKTAYLAVHAEERERASAEREKQAAAESLKRLTAAMASGAERRREGGRQESAAVLTMPPDRETLKRRIAAAAARGEKIYPIK